MWEMVLCLLENTILLLELQVRDYLSISVDRLSFNNRNIFFHTNRICVILLNFKGIYYLVLHQGSSPIRVNWKLIKSKNATSQGIVC